MQAGQITEWIGGRIAFPAPVESLPGGIAQMVIWVELPGQLVVGHSLEDPSAPQTTFGQSLMRAMSSPLVGQPRRPTRVRVADAELARELEGFSFLTVDVAPTPELDAVVRSLDSFFGKGSYFSDPTITPEDVKDLFLAARELWAERPWEVADERCLMQLDSAELGLDEAAVSIVGGLGEVHGFVLFPTIDDFRQLTAQVGTPEEPKSLPHSALYFSFDAALAVPAAMREEVAAHGWELADPDAYPVLMRMVDGNRAPVSRSDLQCASAVARTVVAVVKEHADAFELESELGAEGTLAGPGGGKLRFVVPHSELDDEDRYGPEIVRAETLDDEDNPYGLPISVGQVRELERGLGSFTLHRLIGTFCALASVPRMLPPAAWLPEIVDGASRANEAAVRTLVERVMQVYSHVHDQLENAGIGGLVPVETDIAACREWALGYVSVLQKVDPAALEDEDTVDAQLIIQAVTEAPEMSDVLDEMRGEATRDDALMAYRYELADSAEELYEAWEPARASAVAQATAASMPVRREAAKVGRNDPCPCGSGKKFKKCCG